MQEHAAAEQQQVEDSKRDPQCFEPLYVKYYEPVLRFVYKRIEDLDDCYDVTATVFIKALSNIKKYQQRGLPFKSWLYRIALNEINQYYRDAAKQRIVSIDDHGVNMIKADAGGDDEQLAVLKKALLYLSEDEMQLIELRYFEERPFAEVGEIVNITEANAKIRTYRVMDRLREIFHKIS